MQPMFGTAALRQKRSFLSAFGFGGKRNRPFEILPLDAVVHQSSAHAVGGVINPDEQIMLAVPGADALTVEGIEAITQQVRNRFS